MEKQVAVITGSYKGLGLEIAKKLAQIGNIQVIISSRNESKGLETQQSFQKQGLEVDYHQLDISSDRSVTAFTEYIRSKYGRVEILVNNAGVNPYKQPEESSVLTAKPEIVLSTFDINTVGVLRITQAMIPFMKERNYGRIVNVSTEMASLSQITGDFYPPAPSYRLSKIGLNGLTCSLAKELQNTNILVNSYSPGWMKTDMGGENAPYTVEEGAETAVYLAMLPDGGFQGGFFAEMRKSGAPVLLSW